MHLLLGFIHSFGMNTMRDLTASGAQQQSRGPSNSWLAQQRSNVCDILRYTQPYLTFPDSLERISGDSPERRSPVPVHMYTPTENIVLSCLTVIFYATHIRESVSRKPREECNHGALEWKCRRPVGKWMTGLDCFVTPAKVL